MFTGIVENLAKILAVESSDGNKTFILESSLSSDFKPDQSISHNGVCLTVEKVFEQGYQVTAIRETLEKSNLGQLQVGDLVNIERAALLNSRLDGHLVQGHVDTTATCTKIKKLNGSTEYTFEISELYSALIIEKGSICLNGISLTIFNVSDTSFTVAVIPYTLNHTNIRELQPGHTVNIEFDIVGKYLQRHLQLISNRETCP